MQKILLVIILFLTGCYSLKMGTFITDQQISSLKKNVTTYDQVISTFGNPDSSSMSTTSIDAIYSYSSVKSSTSASFLIPVIGPFISSTKVDTQRRGVSLIFDRTSRKLIDYMVTNGGNSTNSTRFDKTYK